MSRVLLLALLGLVATTQQADPVVDQLPIFKNSTKGSVGMLTTSSGSPVERRYTGSTLNTNINTNPYIVDLLSHFIRENIPERIVHMKGAGAFGYFETTHDVSNICSAEFLSEVGKKTPLVIRFSVGVNEKGASDSTATPMGCAMKMYTQEGNFDLLGLNHPAFVLKDPSVFPAFIRAMKRNPATNTADVNMLWDFATLHPESLYMFMMVFGDQGIPFSYRHMPCFPIHTYQVHNKNGTSWFVRFNMQPQAGLQFMNASTAANTACSNPDYYQSDLYRSIANGNYPKWDVRMQVLSEADVKNAKFDVFDTSKILPENLYPSQPVGQIVLNRNPENHFAQIEQLALNPGHLVPGVMGSPDGVFGARLFFYNQAQSNRLGVNYNNIQVNCPYRSKVFTYNRDGVPPLEGNGYNSPNYYPNSFGGPEPYVDDKLPSLLKINQDEPNNFEQARDHYLNNMSEGERNRFVQTISTTLCYATDNIQKRAVECFSKIHSELSDKLAKYLKNNC